MLNKIIIPFLFVLQQIFGVNQNDDYARNFETVLLLAEFTDWEGREGEFLNVIIAESDEKKFQKAVQYLKNQDFDGKKIKVASFSEYSLTENCEIIFIGQNSGVDMEKLSEKLVGKPILTITTDKNQMGKGCMFYIRPLNEGVEYFFDKYALIKSKLRINGGILSPVHEWN